MNSLSDPLTLGEVIDEWVFGFFGGFFFWGGGVVKYS